MSTKTITRRQVLKRAAGAVGSGALLSAFGGLGSAFAAGPSGGGYRALVNIYLAGGCDTHNLIVPRTSAQYNVYANSRRTLALPSIGLLPVFNGDYGLHPSCAGLQTISNSGRLAVIANTGPLVEPVSKAAIVAGTAKLPPQLFSHIDQLRLQMSGSSGVPDYGWGGRIADLWAAAQGMPQIPLNITLSGNSLWQAGYGTGPYAVAASGVERMFFWSSTDAYAASRRNVYNSILALGQTDANPLVREASRTQRRAIDVGEQVSAALSGVSLPVSFPSTTIGQQLQMIAKLISIRGVTGASRQAFFVNYGGWDTHDQQLLTQTRQFGELSAALLAFHQAMVGLGTSELVTTFTGSDFGRTLSSNGDGSDHGWGGHQLVMGGAVLGGIYGAMPSLALGSDDDMGAGRMIPTTATEQYAATLARWFGLAASDIPLVFPTVSRFATANLGFLNA